MTANQSFLLAEWAKLEGGAGRSRRLTLVRLKASRMHFFMFLCFVSVVRLRNSPSHRGDDDCRQYHRDEDGELHDRDLIPI